MLALGAGLDTRQAMRDGVINGLIIANLKVQERVVLNRAPIAPIKTVAADKIERPGDVAAIALGENQQASIGHTLAEL